jgi:hypothetical protein
MIRGQLTIWIIEPDFYMSFNKAQFDIFGLSGRVSIVPAALICFDNQGTNFYSFISE